MFGGEAELAGCGQIQHRRLAPDFDQHRAKACTTHRIEPGLKCDFLFARMRDQEARGIDAEGGKAMRVEPPRPPLSLVMADPEKGLASFEGPPGEEQGESGGGRDILRLPPDRLVQPPARKAAKALVNAIAAQSEAGGEKAAGIGPGRRRAA